MSVTITVSKKVAQHLDGLSFGQIGDVNQKLQILLEAEYRRRLTHYNLANRQLTQKYDVSFDEFERQQLTKQHNYTWDVESDAIAWETAVDGIHTMQRQLIKLSAEEQNNDN